MTSPKTGLIKKFDPTHPKFATSSSPFYWLQRVAHGHVQNMDAVLKKVGLDVPGWRVLTILIELETASVTTLADHCAMKLSTMTKSIQRLEADDLVTTRTSEADARVTEVLLTAKGRKLVSTARAQAGRVFRQTFRDIDDREIGAFVAMLQRIHTNIHDDL